MSRKQALSKTVGLIVTGQCEAAGLATSLSRVFRSANFTTLFVAESLTSYRLVDPPPISTTGMTSLLQQLASRIVAAVEDDPPDLVVAIDDLELTNADQPTVVVKLLRDAVEQHLGQMERDIWNNATSRKIRKRVRERCSFHLLAPMLETYFFGESAALTRAGASRASVVKPNSLDLELFVTTDPAFLAPKDSARKSSWRKANRARHPKHYLQFLCDPQDTGENRYRETDGGVRALRELAWDAVCANPARVQSLRSLMEDLALGLAVPHPFPGSSHPATGSFATAALLRNL